MKEIVIKIPEDEYNIAKYGQYGNINVDVVRKAIANGSPLPKCHGRLIDADDLYENTEICHSDIDGYACVRWKDINDAPTIIEAERIDNNEKR